MKPTREKVRELIDEGMKPKEIAEKLGIKPATVYTYRHMFKKEEEPIKSEDRENLENENKELKQEIKKLKKANKSISDELIQVKEDYEELTNKHIKMSNSISDEHKEVESLQKVIKELRKENEGLNVMKNRLIDEAREEIEVLESNYKSEKAKHETLFRYITLAKEVS